MIKDINNIDPKFLEEDARIESYLKGQMSADEEQKFLKELEEKPELKEKAIVMARLVKGLKEVGTEQDKAIIDAFLASSEEEVKAIAKKATQEKVAVAPHASKTVSIRKWVTIAASLIFVVWLGFEYNDYRSTTGLGEEYGNVFTSSMISRGAESPTSGEKKLESLFANVKNGKKLDDAIHELSLCWELSTMDTYNDYTNYSAEIGWNLAIAYLKDNNKKDAKKVLEKLIETTEEGTAINIKAKELIEEL